jgi:hypothetical protein
MIINILRNSSIIIISGVFPLAKSYTKVSLPVCATKECASNFHLLMISEKAYNSFYDYLKEHSKDGLKLLSFWTELNVFKHSNRINSSNPILSTDIYEKYLNEGSELYIDFPAKLLTNINKVYLNTSKSIYNDVFDDLGDFAYTNLENYDYPNFKNSDMYKNLEKDLEREEVIYSRLVASSMISTIEID